MTLADIHWERGVATRAEGVDCPMPAKRIIEASDDAGLAAKSAVPVEPALCRASLRPMVNEDPVSSFTWFG